MHGVTCMCRTFHKCTLLLFFVSVHGQCRLCSTFLNPKQTFHVGNNLENTRCLVIAFKDSLRACSSRNDGFDSTCYPMSSTSYSTIRRGSKDIIHKKMAKSLRSKWKRKMRAIKREKMDVKVLARMNKMLVASAAEAKLDAQEEKYKQKMKKDKAGETEEMAEAPATDPPASEPPAETQEGSMEVEGDESSDASENNVQRKLRKPNLKTMRNEKNQFPSWMSTKKIKYHKRLTKRSAKRNTKEAKKNKIWKRACASL